MSIAREDIMAVLARIAVPGGGDLVSRDLVRAVAIEGGQIRFVIEAASPDEARALGPAQVAAEMALKALPGVAAAIVLGISRAFGETMAVLIVVGNVPKIPSSVLDPAYPLPALIANNYGEMLSVPLYDSALMLAALILLLVILLFNVISRVVLLRVERSLR